MGLWQKSVAAVVCGLGSSTVPYVGAEHGPGTPSQLLLETSAFTLAQAGVGPGQAVFSQNPSWESGQEVLPLLLTFPQAAPESHLTQSPWPWEGTGHRGPLPTHPPPSLLLTSTLLEHSYRKLRFCLCHTFLLPEVGTSLAPASRPRWPPGNRI